ncbi:MAG: hypothetical protein HYZ16_09970 [Bacteroidetes bacterium]|jgi:hypothetical protein|nr:hypothetical protein [Bacteroidota bacterium]
MADKKWAGRLLEGIRLWSFLGFVMLLTLWGLVRWQALRHKVALPHDDAIGAMAATGNLCTFEHQMRDSLENGWFSEKAVPVGTWKQRFFGNNGADMGTVGRGMFSCDTHPPLYFQLAYLQYRLKPFTVSSSIYINILSELGILFLLILFWRRLGLSGVWPYLLGVVAIMHPVVITSLLTSRHYTFYAFWALWALYAAHGYKTKGGMVWLIVLFAACLGGMLTHFQFVLLLPVLLWWCVGGVSALRQWRIMAVAAVMVLMLLIGLEAWHPGYMVRLIYRAAGGYATPESRSRVEVALYAPLNLLFGTVITQFFNTWWKVVGVYVALGIVAGWTMAKWRAPKAQAPLWWVPILFFGLSLGMFLASRVPSHVFMNDRYLLVFTVMCLPAFGKVLVQFSPRYKKALVWILVLSSTVLTGYRLMQIPVNHEINGHVVILSNARGHIGSAVAEMGDGVLCTISGIDQDSVLQSVNYVQHMEVKADWLLLTHVHQSPAMQLEYERLLGLVGKPRSFLSGHLLYGLP